jgi:hypothetical protein
MIPFGTIRSTNWSAAVSIVATAAADESEETSID